MHPNYPQNQFLPHRERTADLTKNQSANDIYANNRYLFLAPFEPHKYTVWQNAISDCYSKWYIWLTMGLKWLTAHCSYVHS